MIQGSAVVALHIADGAEAIGEIPLFIAAVGQSREHGIDRVGEKPSCCQGAGRVEVGPGVAMSVVRKPLDAECRRADAAIRIDGLADPVAEYVVSGMIRTVRSKWLCGEAGFWSFSAGEILLRCRDRAMGRDGSAAAGLGLVRL